MKRPHYRRHADRRWSRCRHLPVLVATALFACTADHAARSTFLSTVDADRAIRHAMADGVELAVVWSRLHQSALLDTRTDGHDERSRLALAWDFRNGIVSGYETSPIVVDGVMYISTPLNHVVALDAATGAKKWEYAHQYTTTIDCCGPINRGVAVYGGRVFMGTVDARLVALDAASGSKLWDVQVGANELGYHITSAPVAVAGLVITGISCGEQGGRCYVSAYDAATGASALALLHDPVARRTAAGGDRGRPPTRSERISDATSPRNAATARRTPTRGRTAARRCGMRRLSTPRSGSSISTSAIPRPTKTAARGPATICTAARSSRSI